MKSCGTGQNYSPVEWRVRGKVKAFGVTDQGRRRGKVQRWKWAWNSQGAFCIALALGVRRALAALDVGRDHSARVKSISIRASHPKRRELGALQTLARYSAPLILSIPFAPSRL